MKRFHFQLESVLQFKLQQLDALLVELSAIQARVRAQQTRRDRAYRQLSDFDTEYDLRKREGLTVLEAIECQNCQQVLEQRANRENEMLMQLQSEAESKRGEVVEARKETHSLEKLKELRQDEYNMAIQKSEEKALDDLTAARRAAG